MIRSWNVYVYPKNACSDIILTDTHQRQKDPALCCSKRINLTWREHDFNILRLFPCSHIYYTQSFSHPLLFFDHTFFRVLSIHFSFFRLLHRLFFLFVCLLVSFYHSLSLFSHYFYLSLPNPMMPS